MTSIPSNSETLKSHYPWTSSPLITSAPMRLISTGPLAVEVSRANGIGFLGVGIDVFLLSDLLTSTATILQTSPIPNTPPGILPVGIGFLCWGASLETAVSVLTATELKPAAIWLFAPQEMKDLVVWTANMRRATAGKSQIWIQVCTVKSAVEVARICLPDVLVIQGSDAGGHGLARSASIITLLPECIDTLQREGFGAIPLIAAGGIIDGRGVAAAMTLGASGICMGTRFLASLEAVISEGYRNAIINSEDGGVSTARTRLYDHLRGITGWPEEYNGRAVLNMSFRDAENGMREEENKKLYEEAIKLGDAGWGDQGRMTTYAGTGVGLLQKVIPARHIVHEASRDSRECLARAKARL